MEEGSTRLIPLSGIHGAGRFAIVDAADYDYANQWKWHINQSGYATRSEYLGGGRKGQRGHLLFLHRILMNPPEGLIVDHINGVKLDNRRCNLRLANKSQNAVNSDKPSHNTTGYKGVCFTPTPKSRQWRASICYRGVKRYLGNYATAEEAAEAYKRAAALCHGEFFRE